MRRSRLDHAVLAVALCGAAVPAAAQPAAAAPPALESAAMTALHAMGAYLRTLKAFQVEVATTDEDVLEDGQKLQHSGTTSLLARMPNGLRAEVASDRHERTYLYDGKSFTLYAKRLDLYATIPAPPTVGQLADLLDETATVMVTAAVIGSMVNTLPPSCSTVIVNGFAYQQCGSTWYQPQISGSSTTYIVVNAPR